MMEIPGYSELEVIGSGGFSLVYRARQDRFNRLVAMKVLNLPGLDTDTERRFLRECQIAGGVSNHPNIVTLHDAGLATNGQPYLVFEYMSGGSLAARITRTGPLPVHEVVSVGAKLAGALAAIHSASILHRDIKPSNVLLSAYGEPCLADFGISFVQSTLHATSMTSSLTPLFSAPEVVDGEMASTASDVYSLGATLYAALSGHAPFAPSPGESVSRTLLRIMNDPVPPLDRQDLPPGAQRLVDSMLDRDASARPSAQDVVDRLSATAAGGGIVGFVSDPDATVRRAATGLERTEPATVLRATQEFPSAGQPSAGDAPEPPPRRNRRLGATIGASVAAAALAAGITVVLADSGHSTPLTLSQSTVGASTTGPLTTVVRVSPPTNGGAAMTTPATTGPPPVVTTAPPPAATAPDPVTVAIAQGRAQSGPLLDHWVAQLGAYKSPSGALAALQAAGARYQTALLIDSTDYISKTPGYLDVILDHPFTDATSAVSWCQAAGLTPSTCFAVYLSHNTPFSPSTYQDW